MPTESSFVEKRCAPTRLKKQTTVVSKAIQVGNHQRQILQLQLKKISINEDKENRPQSMQDFLINKVAQTDPFGKRESCAEVGQVYFPSKDPILDILHRQQRSKSFG